MSLCKFPDFNLCLWAENWVEMWPRISASDFCNSADRTRHAIASSMRTCHSCFSQPRVRVVHASTSLVLFQSARLREPCGRVTAISFLPRGRVTVNSFLPHGRVADAYASLLAGHLLNFFCSFHFCKLPSRSLTHSCPIKPETLNTHIKASIGNKRGLRLAKLRPKKHVFNHVIILGRKYKCMLII